MIYLYTLFARSGRVQSKLAYGIPFFYGNKWICYLHAHRNGGVEVGFPRGKELSNQNGLLESKGRKQVWSVTFQAMDEIPEAALLETYAEALALDKQSKPSMK